MKVTPELEALAALCRAFDDKPSAVYGKDVKRGLRDIDGNGVVAGLTEISETVSSTIIDGKKAACDGQLYYQGNRYDASCMGSFRKRFGFEETAYLLHRDAADGT